MKKQQSKNNRVIIITIIIVTLIITTLLTSFLWSKHQSDVTTEAANEIKESINYNPPTKEEQSTGDEQKDILLNEEDQTAPETATVVLSNSSQSDDVVRVRAFISNVIEENGTCTTTLTNGDLTVSKITKSFADASTTQCGAIDFTRNQFVKTGTWQITIKYQSTNVTGTTTGSIEIN